MACVACRERTQAAPEAAAGPGVETAPPLRSAAGVPLFLRSAISKPGDPDEQEAERRSADFVSRHHGAGACSCGSRRDPHGCNCGPAPDVQATVMRKAPAAGGERPPGGASIVVPTRQGLVLGREIRRPYEEFFGADLSHVRVHDGVEADRSAKALHARAYTYDRDIVFAAGEFAPGSVPGQALLAHELTHVVQHAQGGSRIARQPNPQLANPVLTPDEMFQIVVRERAWTFSPGGGQVCVDPAGVGRGVGPAAGGRIAGHSVFAVIQVTDADGRPTALTYGEHVSYSDPHAEQRAVAALRREIPAARDVRGGTMTVVVDQTPCPPGRADCMGTLQRFARERGLRLDIQMPTRQAMRGPRQVAPRTAAMSSMRTDVPPVRLAPYTPPGTVPPAGGTTPGGGAAPSSVPDAPGRATSTMRFMPPRAATGAMMRQQASLLAQMQAQTQRSIRFTARVRLAARGVTGLLGILSAIGTIRTAQQMATYGTIFHEAEEQVDRVGDFGREMQQWAEDTTAEISLLGAMAIITDAEQRGDSDALFAIDSALTDLYLELSPKADEFREWATDLRARERALDVLADFYGDLVSVPMGPSTAPNAEALAMHQSLTRLSGRMGSAAAHFEAAETQLRFYADYLSSLAGAANDRAWSLVFGQIAVAVAEAERSRELSESIRRERRLNAIHAELEQLDAEINQPICRPQPELDALQQRIQMLSFERDLLRGGSPAPP